MHCWCITHINIFHVHFLIEKRGEEAYQEGNLTFMEAFFVVGTYGRCEVKLCHEIDFSSERNIFCHFISEIIFVKCPLLFILLPPI
jgi:hypothetical protein